MDREKVILTAALFHDLGKFLQRAEGMKKKHQDYAEEIVSFLPDNLYSREEKEAIKNMIEFHHFEREKITPPRHLENEIKLICNADRLSACEREEEEEEKDSKSVLTKALINYFSDNHEFLPYPLLTIPGLTAHFYSDMNTWELQPCEKNMYLKRVEEDFIKKIKNIELNSWKDYLDSLLYIFQCYLQFVPSDAYKAKPSISLFDHLKTTALIAHGLIKSNKQNLAIIVCEISGIQKFITMKHKKLRVEDERGYAKLIRGRSFYINLLLDAIWRRLKDEFNLFEFNLIRNVGSLVAIIPYEDGLESRVEKIENEVNAFLMKKFGPVPKVLFGISILNISNELCSSEEKIFKKIREGFDKASKKKYNISSELINLLAEKKKPEEVRESEMCRVCMRNRTGEEICNSCKELMQIGKKLVKIEKIYTCENEGDVTFKFGNLKYSYSFEKKGKIKEVILFEKLEIEKNIGIRIRFLPVYAPCKEESVLSFEEICTLENGEQTKLGVFKSDIDNLSQLFDPSKELCKKIFRERESISRYSFSIFLIDYFHFVFVKNLAKKYNIYVAYSGGDDTMVAGRIDNLLEFVKEFSCYYKKYLSKLTFSGGLAFASPKFPFYTLSIIAEEQLSQSKRGNKNSFTCFSITISWEEFNKMFEKMKKLREFEVRSGKMFAIMRMLDEVANGVEKLQKGRKVYPFEIYPYVLYLLRDIENEDAKRGAKEFFTSHLTKLDNEKEKINSLRMALRFSILLQRFEEKGKKLFLKKS